MTVICPIISANISILFDTSVHRSVEKSNILMIQNEIFHRDTIKRNCIYKYSKNTKQNIVPVTLRWPLQKKKNEKKKKLQRVDIIQNEACISLPREREWILSFNIQSSRRIRIDMSQLYFHSI